jgi:hypothetical protein
VILYILDTNFLKKQSKIYFVVSIIVLVFSLIYEAFSHEVYSFFMLGAFLIPLIFGFALSKLIVLLKLKHMPSRFSVNFYNASIATFTVYSIIKGVLDIYGTTNKLINVYLVVGIICLIISFFTKI